MLKSRYLSHAVLEDLDKKMVFVGGPRQIGKTTLAKEIIARHFDKSAYFNWDRREDRKAIFSSQWPADADILLFDEIHKYAKWKSSIKGEYDTHKERFKFLVTGSARLDVYRRGGDSLQGRYHYYRMHPFSLAELIQKRSHVGIFEEIPMPESFYEAELETLMEFGGFPEPLIAQDGRVLRRWHNEKNERLFREDIRDTQQVRDLNSMRLLSDMLPDKVGSLLSINAIREDLEVSHRALSSWLDILESHYTHFRIHPYVARHLRSLKKNPKLYLWDWSEVDGDGERFENMIASHLHKWVHFLYDYQGYRSKLHFLRNADKKEVDFLVTIDQKPWLAIEVKSGDTEIAPSLFYYRERLEIPFVYQVVRKPGIDFLKNGVRVISASRFLASLI